MIPINKGVMQGSLLSPTLFNIFVNDLIQDLEQKGLTMAYADDIAALYEGKPKLDNVIEVVESWAKRNKIGINYLKSGITALGKCSMEMKKALRYRGFPVVREYKYMGITVSDRLSVREHLKNLKEIFRQYLERRTKLNSKHCTVKNRVQVWTLCVYPKLSYGIESFIDEKSHIRKAASIISQSLKCLFVALGLLPPQQRLTRKYVNTGKKVAMRFPDEFNSMMDCTLFNELDPIMTEESELLRGIIVKHYAVNATKTVKLA